MNLSSSFLQLRVCQGLGTSRRSEQDAGERCDRGGWGSRIGLLLQAVPYTEAVGHLETGHRSVCPQQLCDIVPLHLVEKVSSVLRSIMKEDMIFSEDWKDAYLQIPVYLDSQYYLRIALNGRVFQFKALCFGLSTAPQVSTSLYSDVRVGSWNGNSTPLLPRWLADHHRVSSSSAVASGTPPLTLSGAGDCHQYEEAGPQTDLQGSISWDADTHHLREGLSNGLSDC